MKSKMNIKSILISTIIITVSLMFLNMSLAANTGKVSVETANLRQSASSESEVLEQLSQNEEVEILENSGEWCKVKYKDLEGYVKADLLNIETTEEETTDGEDTTNTAQEETTANSSNTTEETQASAETPAEETKTEESQNNELGKYFVNEDLKIKLVPLINATDMIELKANQEVEVTRIINGWAYVESADSTVRGWVRLDKIKSESQKEADDEAKKAEEEAAAKEAEANAPAIKTSYVQTESVNLRKETNTTSEIVGRLPKNTEVEVLSEENGWSKCRASGLIGFISTQYLGSSKVEEETSRGATSSRKYAEVPLVDVSESGNGSAVVNFAKTLLGKSYKYGAAGPDAFDCSGFTMYVYSQFGVSLPHNSDSQLSCGRAVDLSALAPGDLVIYKNHVAIYIGGGQVIHAANASRGVCISSLNSAASGIKGARRIL